MNRFAPLVAALLIVFAGTALAADPTLEERVADLETRVAALESFVGMPTPKPSPTPTLAPTQAPTPTATPTQAPTPTLAPTVAPTPSPTAPPSSSAYCSDEVHNSYMVKGPDGKMYHGWHPQRDPSGCYFGHEHGSDPSYFSAADEYQPAFGYVNALVGMEEPHVGFKIFRIVKADGQEWLWTVHMGTSGHGRVCMPFHSVELAIADSAGKLLAEIRWMADFGKSRNNKTNTSFHPDACPTQGADASARGSNGVRLLSVNSVGATAQQYEPWKPDLRATVFGFAGDGHIQFNNKSSVTTCADAECNSLLLSGHRAGGAYSVIQSTRFALSPTIAGHFTTDMMGHHVGGVVPQYIAPGWTSAALTHTCSSSPCNWFPGVDPNIGEYRSRSNDPRVKDGKGMDGHYNIDGMLKPPN